MLQFIYNVIIEGMRMESNIQKWIIYKHTAPNGKCYIGQTKQLPECRWQNGRGYEHNTHFYNAIKKYGWENFQHEIIEFDILSQDEANEREIFWIDFFDSYANGYNLTKGGNNHEHIGIPVLQIDITTLEIVNAFPTIRHAESVTNIDHTQIARCCSKDKKDIIAGGFHWCFQDEWFEGWKPKTRKKANIPKKAVYQIDEKFEIVAKYESGLSAQIITGIPAGRISRVCHHKGYISAGGYHWCFVEEWCDNWRPILPKDERPVVRISKKDFTDIKIYPMISVAARECGIKCSEQISRVCNGKIISTGNFYWCYLADYNENWSPREDLNRRKIICVETRVIYNSISEAIKSTQGSPNIARACKDSGLTSGGYHWAYLNDFNSDQWQPRKKKKGKSRAVRCIETGEIFESAVIAGKTKGIDNSSISKCCKNPAKNTQGLHWAFEN